MKGKIVMTTVKNEKIIFETKWVSKMLSKVFFALGVLAIIAGFITAVVIDRRVSAFFAFFGYGYYGFVIGAIVFFVMGFIFMKKRTITITDKRFVYQIASFGRIDIPISKITSVGIGRFKSLSIGTPAGMVRLPDVRDYYGVFNVISLALVERERIMQEAPAPEKIIIKKEEKSQEASMPEELPEL